MDRKTAETLASRATCIAAAVLGDSQQALEVVARAAERVRQEGTQGVVYQVQFFRAVIAETEAAARVDERQRSVATSDDQRGSDLDLHRLSIEDRILVVLCSVGGLSYSEAAQVTALSKQQVLTQLASARRRLWEART